jgi:hypothetical protein
MSFGITTTSYQVKKNSKKNPSFVINVTTRKLLTLIKGLFLDTPPTIYTYLSFIPRDYF